MKNIKKMLVVLLAVAVIATMSASAFAAGSVTLTKVDEKNISVDMIGAIGMTDFDFVVTADEGIVVKNVKKTSESGACDAAGNSFDTLFNKDNGSWAGHFLENLWERSQWETAADDNGEEIPASFDPAHFNMGTIVYDASGATGPAYIYVKGSMKNVEGVATAIDEKVLVVEGAEPTTEAPAPVEPTTEAPAPAEPTTEAPAPVEPTTEAPAPVEPTTKAPAPVEPTTKSPVSEEPAGEEPSKEEPSKEEPSKEEPTKEEPTKSEEKPTKSEEKPTKKPAQADGGVNTGDNMALAAAFGVVALAGAAFVLTKKRK